MSKIFDELMQDIDSTPGDRAALASLARDSGRLLRPRDEHRTAAFLRALASATQRFEWLEDAGRAFEAGALFAIEELLGAAAAEVRADFWHEREDEAARARTVAGRILDALREEGELSPSELASRLGLALPQVSRALQRLREDGAVVRLESRPGEDRRVHRYALAAQPDAHLVVSSPPSTDDMFLRMTSGDEPAARPLWQLVVGSASSSDDPLAGLALRPPDNTNDLPSIKESR